jgi:hypothetical protein
MCELNEWDLTRSVILFIVLTLHLALLALLAIPSRTGAPPALAQQAVELLYLPPEIVPKIRSENARPRRLNGGTRARLVLAVGAILVAVERQRIRYRLAGGSAPRRAGVRHSQPSAATGEPRLGRARGGELVAAASRRRTIQDRERRLDRVGQRKLLSSRELGRLCARRRAPPDRLSRSARGATLIVAGAVYARMGDAPPLET